MKSITFFAVFILVFTLAVKSQDTTYLDYDEKPVLIENSAYQRIVLKTDTGVVEVVKERSGRLKSVTAYKDQSLNTQHGYARYYYEDGTISGEGNYEDGQRNGLWKIYHENGKLAALVRFGKQGLVADSKYFTPNGDVESDAGETIRLPSYPGGTKAMGKYLATNVKVPKNSRAKGTVKVAFTISRRGKISGSQILSGINPEINAEALRVINNMPDWIPGIQFNVPVDVRYIIPITFN